MVEKKALELLNSKTPDKEPMTWQHYLTKYTNDFAKAAMQRYMELGDRFGPCSAVDSDIRGNTTPGAREGEFVRSHGRAGTLFLS